MVRQVNGHHREAALREPLSEPQAEAPFAGEAVAEDDTGTFSPGARPVGRVRMNSTLGGDPDAVLAEGLGGGVEVVERGHLPGDDRGDGREDETDGQGRALAHVGHA